MKIYYHPLSPPSMLSVTVARILGFSPKLELVDLMEGANFSEDYQKLNPHAKVPTLHEEDGFVLSESGAIIKYLAERASGDIGE